MILLVAVIAGLAAGFIRAAIAKRTFQPQNLNFIWLVFVALFAQWIVFTFEPSRTIIPDLYAGIVLVLSQFLLLIFAWENRRLSGFWLLGLGLLLNLTVILLNGGWMPISPETVSWLVPDAPEGAWQIGARLAAGKDKVILVEQTRLWFLSDQLRTPEWLGNRIAFSIGDVVIAIGAFWLLWSAGGSGNQLSNKENIQ